MKIRLVKKASRIFREQPDRAKPCHWRIAMRSWRLSLKKLNVVERYAIGIMLAGSIHSAIRAHMNIPKDKAKTFAVICEQGHEMVMDPRGNVRGIDGKLYDINLNPIIE